MLKSILGFHHMHVSVACITASPCAILCNPVLWFHHRVIVTVSEVSARSEEKQLIVAWYWIQMDFHSAFHSAFHSCPRFAQQFLSGHVWRVWRRVISFQAKALKENVNLNTIATLDDERCRIISQKLSQMSTFVEEPWRTVAIVASFWCFFVVKKCQKSSGWKRSWMSCGRRRFPVGRQSFSRETCRRLEPWRVTGDQS